MNYPDNIRDFDNDPRSPFYEQPECHCGNELIEKGDDYYCSSCDEIIVCEEPGCD